MILYIAGPMTGLPRYNYDSFFAAEKELKEAGYEVLNPAMVGPDDEESNWPHPREWYLRRSLTLLLQAQGVALLDNWAWSDGVKLEVSVASALNMPIHPLWQWLVLVPDEEAFMETK